MSARDRVGRASRHMHRDPEDAPEIEVVIPGERMQGNRHLGTAQHPGVYRKKMHALRRGLADIRQRDIRLGFDPAMPPESQLLEREFVITLEQALRLDDLFAAYSKPRSHFLRLVVDLGIKALEGRMPTR